MNSRIKSIGAPALVVVALACSDATGVEPEDLAGTWEATSAFLINAANTTQTEDFLALGGFFTLELGIDGSAVVTVGDATDVETQMGTLTVVGSEVMLVFAVDTVVGTLTRDGDMMMLTLIKGLLWNFDGTGIVVPVTLDLELLRVSRR